MKKAFALFCTLLLLRPPVHAQLPSGSVAPNFKSTDLKGNEWELYELLRQNKIVVLEAMATWCPPCWNYHNSGALQSLYTRYGPEGTDKLRVLLVEGDKETTTDCLLGLPGCDKGTLGNYTDGLRLRNEPDFSVFIVFSMACTPLPFQGDTGRQIRNGP